MELSRTLDARPAIQSREPFSGILARLFDRLALFSQQRKAWEFLSAGAQIREINRDKAIWAEQDGADGLFVIEKGFAYQFDLLPGGQRYIGDLFGPGAICNWNRLEEPAARINFLIKAGSKFAVISQRTVRQAFREFPLLRTAIVRHELMRSLRNAQRTRTLIAMAAPEQVMGFLLDLQDELGLSQAPWAWITCPLNQQEMADLLGLSSVHVNRTLRLLLDTNRLLRQGRAYRIVDRDGEVQRLDYQCFGPGMTAPDDTLAI